MKLSTNEQYEREEEALQDYDNYKNIQEQKLVLKEQIEAYEMYAQHQQNENYRKDREQTAKQVKWGTCIWLVFVIITLIIHYLRFDKLGLDNSVLIALVSSTTASVIGMFVIILRWLYPHK